MGRDEKFGKLSINAKTEGKQFTLCTGVQLKYSVCVCVITYGIKKYQHTNVVIIITMYYYITIMRRSVINRQTTDVL